ncbi:uncharacterized protein ACIQIH_014583 isoform 2-T2 [Cyanocitta cristata]
MPDGSLDIFPFGVKQRRKFLQLMGTCGNKWNMGSKARSPSSPWELISAGQKKILRPGCFLAREPVQEARAGGGSTGVKPFQALSDEEGEVPTAPNCPLIPHLGFVHVFPPEEYLVLQGLCLHWPFMDFSSANHFDACIALKQSSHFFLHCSAWSFCWR